MIEKYLYLCSHYFIQLYVFGHSEKELFIYNKESIS